MTEPQRIADQLHRSIEGPAWHGPAFLELLEGLTPRQAAARPIAGWKSIWELVLHATVWQNVVRRRLAGHAPRITIGGPRDWPPPPRPTDAAWRAAIARLRRASRALEAAARAWPAAKLDKPPARGGSSVYVQLHGAVQHNLWHAGQASALKRALGLPAVVPGAVQGP